MLNTDVLRYISRFLLLPDYYSVCTAHRDFYRLPIARRRRFEWSSHRIQIHGMKQGWCAQKDCINQRLYCISLEPVRTQTLSVYCGQCTLLYKKISTTLLLL